MIHMETGDEQSGRKDILYFISQFKDAKSTFLYGCCYWFAYILKTRFGGSSYYEPVEGHFVHKINGRLYDVRGDVTAQYRNCRLVCWETYKDVDPAHYRHLVRDCVLKEKCDE